MRTTLDIDEDILAAAKDLAKVEGKTMGQVISDLARRGLTTPASLVPPGLSEGAAAFEAEDELFPRLRRTGGIPITNELIRRIQDELDMEDAVPWDHERDAPREFDEEPRKKRKK
jgi:hypothetical protein